MANKKLANNELENQVLDVLWASDAPLTPGDVHGSLSKDHPLAYTTVMTILVRLCDKGLLVRERTGRAFAYRPVISKEERSAARMQEMLATAGDPAVALNRFVEALGPAQREALRRALRSAGRSKS